MDTLAAFLTDRRGYAGPWNCSTLAADWCVSRGYPDFAARWRGTIDPVACEVAAPDAGGLLAHWQRDIGDGLPRTDEPQRGDIGVVMLFGKGVGAICTGPQWALAGPRTLHFVATDHVELLGAWRP